MEPRTIEAEGPRWNALQRIGWRFLFAYFLLFVLTGEEIRQIPFLTPLFEKYTELWHAIAVGIGRHLLGIRHPIALDGDGSGDTTFRWILLLCYPVLAAAVALVWSALDRKRERDERTDQVTAWLRFLLRFTLATAMIVYGMIKVIPNQMPAPRPTMLLQRLGELTPMRLLWTYMGASAPYQIFTGLAELLGGVLLLVPRTTLFGALVVCADMTMVLMLNLCYDVPAKINSFHYWIMAVILIAPDARRLFDALVLNRTVEPAPAPLFERGRRERAAQILFLIFGVYLIGVSAVEGIERYRERNPPKPPFYGAWTVEEFTVDGKDVPLFTDPQRWRWAIFQNSGRLTVKTMIGSFHTYPLALDRERKMMQIGKDRFSLAAPEADVLVLEGHLEGRRLRAKLRRMALRPSFHWLYDPEIE
jgi:uncharacterized membrane protein YphA (DoxX/SURF4 family)